VSDNDKLEHWRLQYEQAKTRLIEENQSSISGCTKNTAVLDYWAVTEVYIGLLINANTASEQRVKDLETILKVSNEPVGRDVTAELGHVRGLDVPQYLDGVWQRDKQSRTRLPFIGRRYYTSDELEVLQRLAERGYVTIDADTRTCWIREAGMNYLATLKSEVFGK
jgi:hypothetical protein